VARRRQLCRAWSGAASLAVQALGTSVLAGWWLESPLLKSGVPDLVAMNPVTAIGFVLLGLSLWRLRTELGSSRSRLGARLLASAVVLLALLCLSRLYTPWDLGLDRLVFRDQVAVASAGHSNRMAPNTGMNFVLLGLALVLLDSAAWGFASDCVRFVRCSQCCSCRGNPRRR
jgi:hypothetical protein